MMRVADHPYGSHLPPLIPADAEIQREKAADGRRGLSRPPHAARWRQQRGLRPDLLGWIRAFAGMSGKAGCGTLGCGILVVGIVCLALLSVTPAFAVQPDEMLQDPTLEARARAISAGLRCLVCQNQSIDDSAAPLARDLRLIVREHLKTGDSDDEVRRYLVARYGDFVLLKPPFEPATWLLWGTPFLIVLAGGAMLLLRRRAIEAPTSLSAEERVRVEDLLHDMRRDVS